MTRAHDHLGLRVSALADGALGHDDRDRALAHVAECPDCLRLVEIERRLKAAIGALPELSVPAALMARLSAIPDPPTPPPPARRQGGVGVALHWTRPARRTDGARPAGRTDARTPGARRSDRLRRAGALTGGLLSVTGVALVTAFAVGAPVSGERVVPPVATLTGQHSAISDRRTFGDPSISLLQVVPAGGAAAWGSTSPVSVPASAAVSTPRLGRVVFAPAGTSGR